MNKEYKEYRGSWIKVFAFLSTYCYILGFYLYFNLSVNTMGYCLIHGTFSSMLLIYVLDIMKQSRRENRFSVVLLFFYISVLYAHISCMKYVIQYLYPGFIEDNNDRLVGSLVVLFVMWATIFIWNYFSKKHYHSNESAVTKLDEMNINQIMLWTLVIILGIVKLFAVKSGNANETKISFVVDLVMNITLAFTVINYKPGRIIVNRFKIPSGLLPIITIFSIYLYCALITGKRSAVIVLFVILICSLIMLNKINFIYIEVVTVLAPIGIACLTIALGMISKRYDFFGELLVRNLVYRFDLSDFAITLSSKMPHYQIETFIDGIRSAIPAFIYPGKMNYLQSYYDLMSSCGLRAVEDFNDTVFSMGTQLFGYWGLFLTFPLISFFFSAVDTLLNKLDVKGMFLKILLIGYFAQSIESDWARFAVQTRNAILIALIGYVVWVLINKLKLNRKIRLVL